MTDENSLISYSIFFALNNPNLFSFVFPAVPVPVGEDFFFFFLLSGTCIRRFMEAVEDL